eukprot:TRINITY_DN7026_c0_g1_i1.p1 TRINITY_DN7026_c0_g1~~TRINITY_DN7026_c0_g1_i1.p1  ORF type:complete len:534 (-),score=85.09 TRINITY_DN7026_c0_g1_i1:15-1526(-)
MLAEGFRFTSDHKIVSFPWWKKLPEQDGSAIKRKLAFSEDPRKKRKEEAELALLPPECLIKILSFLSLAEKRCCRLLARIFCHLLDNHLLECVVPMSFNNVAQRLHEMPKMTGVRTIVNRTSFATILGTLPSKITKIFAQVYIPLCRCWSSDVRVLSLKVQAFGQDLLCEEFRQLTSLSITTMTLSLVTTAQVDLSAAQHLTSLEIMTVLQQHCDDILATLPYPEKMVNLALLVKESPKIAIPPSMTMEGFVNVKVLKLRRYNTTTTFLHLEQLSMYLVLPNQIKAICGPSPIWKMELKQIDPTHTKTILDEIPDTVRDLSIIGHFQSIMEWRIFPHLHTLRTSKFSMYYFSKSPNIRHVVIQNLTNEMLHEIPINCTRISTNLARELTTALPPQVKTLEIRMSVPPNLPMMPNVDVYISKNQPNLEEVREVVKRNYKFTDPMMKLFVQKITEIEADWKKLRASTSISEYFDESDSEESDSEENDSEESNSEESNSEESDSEE